MNNTTFYKLLGNLNHNGTTYEKGTYVDGMDFGGSVNQLVADGVLKPIDGATTAEEAAQLDAEETENVEAATTEVASQDTWGARPDEDEQKPENEGGPGAPEGSGDAPAVDAENAEITPEVTLDTAPAEEKKEGIFGKMFGGNKDAANGADNL